MADRAGQEAEDDLLSQAAPVALEELAARLQAAALERHSTVVSAESCTGGLIGHIITEIPGSSRYYRGGVVSYADQVKVETLGVPTRTIERHGAVSAQVAVAMAGGVRERLGADYGVAVTGVAGPDGGTSSKPVGLTYVAVSGPAGDHARRHRWHGGRSDNKHDSARAALELLLEIIEAAPLPQAS